MLSSFCRLVGDLVLIVLLALYMNVTLQSGFALAVDQLDCEVGLISVLYSLLETLIVVTIATVCSPNNNYGSFWTLSSCLAVLRTDLR